MLTNEMGCWSLVVVDIILYQLIVLLDVVATGLLTSLPFVGVMLKQLTVLPGDELVLPATPTNIFNKFFLLHYTFITKCRSRL